MLRRKRIRGGPPGSGQPSISGSAGAATGSGASTTAGARLQTCISPARPEAAWSGSSSRRKTRRMLRSPRGISPSPAKPFTSGSRVLKKTSCGDLRNAPRTPHRKRTWRYTPLQYEKVAAFRRQHLRYGKMKLALYRREYPHETISAWQVQCNIQASGVYYEPAKFVRTNRKRARA